MGCPELLRVGDAEMSARRRSPPTTRTSPPSRRRPATATPEVDDQPLGPPADLDEDDAPLPGLPESEPPAAD